MNNNLRFVVILYIITLVGLVIYSYGFIDPNFPYSLPAIFSDLVYTYRLYATVIYICIVSILLGCYLYFLDMARKKLLSIAVVWKIIFVSAGILLLSYPGFSYDIFNYIATAKVLFHYGENPYVVMPIEIANESMLSYMHAANKTALYGPSWVALTAIPYMLSFGSIISAIIGFKLFISSFYLGIIWLIYRISKKNILAVVFFALNPLVIIETLVSTHNDVAMMFFALLAFFLIKRRLFISSFVALLFSIGVKYATVVLIPIYAYAFYQSIRKKSIQWDSVWQYSALFLFVAFTLSPIREEMYSWYLVWPLVFIALLKDRKIIKELVIALSYGLLMRFVPFIYSRNWFGITPRVKIVVTTAPILMVFVWRFFKR